MVKLRHLLKYLGGKWRLAPKILEALPETIHDYVEPFCGSCAVFAALCNAGRRPKGTIRLNDTNKAVIELLHVIRDRPADLNASLAEYQHLYDDANTEKRSLMYYDARNNWNADKAHPNPGRFLFLKQTSFNGLWRVSKTGDLNAAWGKYEKPRIRDDENILAWHEALQGVGLSCVNAFEMRNVDAGEVAYVDPPYLGTFAGYTEGGFDFADHARLLQRVHEWREQGAFVAYSNSNKVKTLLSVAWPTANLKALSSSYTVNTDGAGRGHTEELLAYEAGISSGKVAA